MEWNELPHDQGLPGVTGVIRSYPEDFQIDEIIDVEPSGEGEHVWLRIRKRGINTQRVAEQLAAWFGVKESAVSYAGLKDRHAVAEQWFSVHLPGKDLPEPLLSLDPILPDTTQQSDSNQPDWVLLWSGRHQRKLRRGALRGNRFTLVIREISDSAELQHRWQRLIQTGVPNYFGPQRFGHQGGNLQAAEQLFQGARRRCSHYQRGIYLSAARAQIFNGILAHRVQQGTWNRALCGDVLMLAGSHSCFPLSAVDNPIIQRIESQDLHPTGPLWGSGELLTQGAVRILEETVAAQWPLLCQGLVRYGLKQERRSLRLIPSHAEWLEQRAEVAVIRFQLPAGGYATTVLRELLHDQQNAWL